MSKSNDILNEVPMSRSQRDAAEDAKHRKTAKIYGIATLLLLVAAVGAVVWNTGFFQSRSTAVTINGEDFSTTELNYYYNAAVMEETYNAYNGASVYDASKKPQDQMYDFTKTYQDYFREVAVSDLQSICALLKSAADDGFTLDDATIQSDLDSYMDQLQTEALYNGYTTAEQYIVANMGENMTLDLFKDIYTDQMISVAYAQHKGDEIEVSDDQMTTYYNENKDDLDSYRISYTVHVATEPVPNEGETLTDEELAAGLAEEQATQKANAEALAEDLKNGEDITELGDKYDAYGAYESDVAMGSQLNSSFSDWVVDADRKSGDITTAEYDGGDRFVYYVIRFEDRYQDNTPTADVRHILVGAGADPTEEEYAEAHDSAEKLLNDWKSGDATADSFAALAMLNSADTQSAQNGGLISGLTPDSLYIDSFLDWSVDADRTAGDTGLVQNTQSSVKGWHVMYFDSWQPSQWEIIAKAAILGEELTEWHDALVADTTAELGSGIKYVG